MSAERYAIDRNIALKGDTAMERRNNMAVDMIYRGRISEAIEALKELEAEQPGDYVTAANLGTAYELAGKNEDALRWIRESIERNQGSHWGTEWLHVDILEAKLKAANDPKFFDAHSVLDLDHQQVRSMDSEVMAGGERRRVREIVRALDYQLEERLRFVKASDPGVASLLYDYAAIQAATHSLESARELLKMAGAFGYPQTRLNPLIEEFDHTIFVATLQRWILYGGIVVTIVALIIHAVQRRWIVVSRAS
jgi:tetratricopeptide (TPR) repeat protein